MEEESDEDSPKGSEGHKTAGTVNVTLRIAQDECLVKLTLDMLSGLEKLAIFSQST